MKSLLLHRFFFFSPLIPLYLLLSFYGFVQDVRWFIYLL